MLSLLLIGCEQHEAQIIDVLQLEGGGWAKVYLEDCHVVNVEPFHDGVPLFELEQP